MHFQPLRSEDLAATQKIASSLFPWEDEHEAAHRAALDPAGSGTFLLDHRLDSVRCWTANGENGLVRGFATVYGYSAQPDESWLAWFGLAPEARGRGTGARLLDWVIAHVQTEGRRTLRLWTTDEAEYAVATRLYLRRGFVAEPVSALPGDEWRTMVFSLPLDNRPLVPWSGLAGQIELCGRQRMLTPAA